MITKPHIINNNVLLAFYRCMLKRNCTLHNIKYSRKEPTEVLEDKYLHRQRYDKHEMCKL